MQSPRTDSEEDFVESIVFYAMKNRNQNLDVDRAVENAYKTYMDEFIYDAKDNFKSFKEYIVAETNKRRGASALQAKLIRLATPRTDDEINMVERIILYAMQERVVTTNVERAVDIGYKTYMKELANNAKDDYKAFKKYIVAEINKRRAPIPERSIRDYMPHDGFPLGDPRYRPDGRYASDSIKQVSDRFMGVDTSKTAANKYALVVTFQQYNDRMFELTELGKSLPDFLKAPLMKEVQNTAQSHINAYRGKISGNFKYDKGVLSYPDDFNDQLEDNNLWKLNDKAFKRLTALSWLHFDD